MDLTLPTEWIQLFRIVLSIYLVWLILLTPRKPIFNNDLKTRFLFIILLILLVQTDFISGLLLLIIYFLSFQSVLPINFEGYDNTSDIIKKIDENLKASSFTDPPIPTSIKLQMSYGGERALRLT
jgi:hypothetical protein